MKSIKEIDEVFSFFNNHSEQFYDVSNGENWQITAFRPFQRNGQIVYSFRLYGKVTGSKFPHYNKEQWCGGVDYKIDLSTDELHRFEYEHTLHPSVQKLIDVPALLKRI